MEDMMHREENVAALTEAQKEALYQRAIGYLTSSLTNDELYQESLDALLSLGGYKDSEALYAKYSAQFVLKREETASLARKRRASRIFQGIAVTIGLGIVLILILILVYALKLDVVR